MPLDRLSLGEGSGWRAPSEARVAQLRKIFRAGQFGQSRASGVQILAKEDVDGARLIGDGISTAAVVEDPFRAAAVVEDP